MTRSADTARWKRTGELFHELVELDDSHRSERLSRLRSADMELCADVETLLAGDAIADERLPIPGFGLRLAGGLPQRDPLRLEGQMVARFRVLEHVASGGMGVVYRAEDTQLDRTVALKFPLIDRDLSDSLRTRIISEARSAGALDHPNLCPIYEIGESSAGPFFAMPLYRGESLKQRLARTGRMDVSEALAIATQLAAGLECAHRAGVVHRDMKPGNVMLVADGTAKVLDFGLARTATADVSNPCHALGTILYMAPEQIRGEQVDHRVDLWSLGVILYEMLAGARPFAASNDAAMLHSILRYQPPPLREIDATIPPAVEELVAELLEKDQRRRAQSAQEVVDAIAVIVKRNESRTMWRALPLRNRRLLNRAIVGTAVALAMALTGLAWMRPGRTLIGRGLISPNDTLVMADFIVPEVDSALSRPLSQLVRRDFADSKLVSLMSLQSVRSVLERMRRSPDNRLTPEIAREIAQREGARALISGELTPLKSGYLVTLRLVAAESGDELSSVTRTAANPEKDLLPALADAGQALRSRIGESLRDVPFSTTPKRQVTTSSLAAFRMLYTARERTGASGIRAVREAVTLDSTFAYAWMTLGNFLSGLGRNSVQDSALTRAYRYREHLTLMERAQIAGLYDIQVLRDRTRALVVLESALAQDSAIGFAVPANVAALLMQTRQFDRAETLARRLEKRSPDRLSWHASRVIASALTARGRFALADSVLVQLTAKAESDSLFPLDAKRNVALSSLRYETAGPLVERASRVDIPGAEANWLIQSAYQRTRGRLRDALRTRYAVDSLSTEVAAAADVPLIASAARTLDLAREDVWLRKRPAAAVARLDTLQRLLIPAREIQNRIDASDAAALYAAAGRPSRARALLAASERAADTVSKRWTYEHRQAAMAEIALAEGRYNDAMRLFRESDVAADHLPVNACSVCILPHLARVADRAGWADSSRIYWERYVTEPSLDRTQTDQWFLATAYRRLAAIYYASGNAAISVAYRRKLSELWKHADADLERM